MYAKIDISAAGQAEIVAAVAGKQIRVMGYVLAGAGTVTAKWQSASTDKSGPISLSSAALVCPVVDGDGWIETVEGEALNLYANAAVQVSGHLVYRLIG